MAQIGGFQLHAAACPLCGKNAHNPVLPCIGQILDDNGRPILFAACREHYAEAREHILERLAFPRARQGIRSDRSGPFQEPAVSPRQNFESFGHVFGCSSRVFALLGQLHPDVDGRFLLRDFLAAFSWFCRAEEIHPVAAALLPHLERAGWERVADSTAETAFRSAGFTLFLRVAPLPSGKGAIHLFLGHGNMEPAMAQYLGHMLPHHAERILAADPSPGLPRGMQRPPRISAFLSLADLARRLRSEPCTVYTGAGVSTASGIRSFTGPGSLDACLQLAEPFPLGLTGTNWPPLREAFVRHREPFAGSALEWMLHRPMELASLIGSFQASWVTAQPNRAHLALKELEHRGVVQQILTSNFDDLHQAAGSMRVKEISTGDNSAAELRGKLLLAAGVSRDEYGLLRAARAAGMDVVVLNPEVPEFVQESDLYLPGRAELVLPELLDMLGP